MVLACAGARNNELSDVDGAGHDQHGQALPLGGGGGGLHYPHVAQAGGGDQEEAESYLAQPTGDTLTEYDLRYPADFIHIGLLIWIRQNYNLFRIV